MPPNGTWRTIRGHHVYIVNGKIVAGSLHIDGKAKKATKAHLKEFQAHIDKESKGADKNDKTKKPTKKAVSKTSTKEGKKSTGASKTEPKKGTSKTAKQSGAKKSPANVGTPATNAKKKVAPKASEVKKPAPKVTPKTTAKKTKDIRTEAQQNREVAYDVGEKVWGSRKDLHEINAMFVDGDKKATLKNLEDLEKLSPETAQKLCVKKNLLSPVDYDTEFKKGTELPMAMLKQAIYDRITPKPVNDTPESRKQYMYAIQQLQRIIEPIKTISEFRDVYRDLKDRASKEDLMYVAKNMQYRDYQLKEASREPSSYELSVYRRGERIELTPKQWKQEHLDTAKEYEKKIAQALEFQKNPILLTLGDKLHNFFNDYESRDRTLKTIASKKATWESIGKKEEKTAPKPKGENKTKVKWERSMPAKITRSGGRTTPVKKPEDMIKTFGMRGVEFGHWVDDHAGKFHLVKASEAYHDLADILGIKDKDVSLNGKLAMAFGARGVGKALAHYESQSKIMNLTKNGGAGSLAHEWGHALDNIMYQYSHDGRPSMNFASDTPMGDSGDPAVKEAYKELVDTIMKGNGTGGTSVMNKKNSYYSYYRSRRDDVGSLGISEALKKHAKDINRKHDEHNDRLKRIYSAPHEIDKLAKALKKSEMSRKRQLNELAQEMMYHHKHHTGEELELVKIPNGTSDYYSRMQELDGGGKPYWATKVEMFARVFESYVEDQMQKKKIKNDYLVHGTKFSGQGNPFPHGDEREMMNKAMGKLLTAIKGANAIQKALEMEELHKALFTEEYLIAKAKQRLLNLMERRGETPEQFEAIFKAELEKTKQFRCAYRVTSPSEVFYIPLNRIKTPYQTDQATNWDKVRENVERIKNGENLDPVVIGYDYDLHDGHHRLLASEALNLTHVPCEVRGTNEIEVQRAKEQYAEVWKSIVIDPVGDGKAFPVEESNNFMWRGVGQKELYFILKNGYIKSKGKGNDEDQKLEGETCYSCYYKQAEDYARSNYDLYDEKSAYVLTIRKPEYMMGENELGELVTTYAIPKDYIVNMQYIPKE